MKSTLIGMLIVFVSMLPSVPVRAYVPPYWQHLLVKAEWAFIITCMLLFIPLTNTTNLLESLGGYFGVVVVAPLAGLFVSMGLTTLVLGKMPEAENPPTDERYVDPLFDWSREAVVYKFKRLFVPYAVGTAVAVLLYLALS